MLLTNIITTFFSLLFVFTAISVILSKNPVYSVLSLIACFFNATSLLFILGIEFVPVSFIVIYVGAIAVLFLFVLMMLNLKASELNQNNSLIMPILVILFFAFFIQYFLLFNNDFYCFNAHYNLNFFFEFINSFHLSHFINWLFVYQNIESIGVLLFTTNSFQFLITSLILLVAMVSSIVLTLHKQFSFRSQTIHYQILTKHNKSIEHFY